MRLRWALGVAAMLMLPGCQPAGYDILMQREGSGLVLTVRGAGSWPFRTEAGINAEWVQVRDEERILWLIERDPDRPHCRAEGKTPPFPLTYGRVPRCFREVVASQPISADILYKIEGSGFRSGVGFFRLGRLVQNLDWGDVSAEVSRWRNLPDPRWPHRHDASNTIAAPATPEAKAVSASKP